MKWTAESSLRLAASRQAAFEVLRSYVDYPTWLPGVSRTRLLAEERDVVVVEIEAPRLGSERLVLEAVHTAPESVIFSQVDRYRSRGLFGQVELREVEPGVEVTARASLIASPLRLPLRRALKGVLQSSLEAFGRRCLRGRPAASMRRRLLSVVRRGERLEIWVEDEPYELVPRAERAG